MSGQGEPGAARAENPYAAYPEFERAFQADHAAFAAEFPFALMAMEHELRKERAGIAGFGQARGARRIERWGAGLLLSIAALIDGRATRDGFYARLSGMAELRQHLSRSLAARGLHPVADDRILGFGRVRQLHALATRGAAFDAAMRSVARQGAAATAADRALMARLDRTMRRNRDAVTRLIERRRIRLFVSDGDCLPYQRVLADAARHLGRPYVTIAHGYIQNRHLVSIAPIRGDLLLTWTARERDDVRAVLDATAARRVASLGFPRPVATAPGDAGDSILLAWDPISLRPQSDWAAQVAALGEVVDALRPAGVPVRLRLHPKDRTVPEVLAGVAGLGAELSEEPLGAALARARIVVGSTSSVLFEAIAAGRPALQIAEHCRGNRIEGAGLAPVTELAAHLRDLSADRPAAVAPFDLAAFLDLLDGLHTGSRAG